MDPKSATLRVFLSEAVKYYFEPFYAFLDFKSTFDPIADGQRQVLDKIFCKFSNNEFLQQMLDALSACQDITIQTFHEVFNANPHVIPCQNGLLDFRTLEIRPLRREDYFTYKINCEWNAEAETEGAKEFIISLFPYDTQDIYNFITCWLGYCMTGLTFMQICTFFIGYGSNGKSKLTQVMENILGPVAFAKVSCFLQNDSFVCELKKETRR